MATEIQGAEYSWTGPNGFTSSAQNPIIQSAEFNMSGTYQVSVFNPSDSCLSIASVNVFVHPYPIDVSITGNIAVCAGDSLILHTTQYSNAEYTWYKSGNVYSHDTMLIFQPANTGNQGIYSCSINIEGCINSSAEEEVFVYPNPVNPILLFDPLYNSLQAFPIGGNFQWYLGEDLIVGQTYDTLQLELTGNYMVILTNEFGCTASSQYFVYDPTGIPELPISRLALQPNPARDFIQVLVPELGVLEVLDLAGKRVKENKLLLGLNSISVNELAAGIYLFQFHSNSGVRIAKVIVEHNY
jgi:hypothetical protein